MTVELAEVAAGLPVAASFALAGGLTNLREGRRRAALNEAMHELRRPLQVLSLSLPADLPPAAPVESSLQLVTVALERLEREVNGGAPEEAVTEVSVTDLIDVAVRRWSKAVTLSGTRLRVDRNGNSMFVVGDPFSLAQALDNLLSNAIEHGGGEVRIGCCREGGWVRIWVSDGGVRSEPGRNRPRPRRGGSRRRGHGLRVVARTADRHGGSFSLRRGPDGAEASLRLPLSLPDGER
ncbi:MAG TPA: HAMP domain-containing sensor histidine kinase [Solirubrobacterales bacterium]|nr:HAMP domain-containing sensor histidine kinase [Solirubrobacterales bacterium]